MVLEAQSLPRILQDMVKNNFPDVTLYTVEDSLTSYDSDYCASDNILENFPTMILHILENVGYSIDSLLKVFMIEPYVQMPNDDVPKIHDIYDDAKWTNGYKSNTSSVSIAVSPSTLQLNLKILKILHIWRLTYK